jgi:hypothetical protein
MTFPVVTAAVAQALGIFASSPWGIPMSVTEEDGGKLNAFAKEPRMEVVEAGGARSRSTTLLLIGGAALVLLLVAVAMRIS